MNFEGTPEQIVEATLTWKNWPGFTGDRCSCGKTANVLGRGPGWFCACGAFNQLGRSMNIPYDNPHIGPDKHVLDQVRAQLIYPPYVHRGVFVRRRQPGDKRWRIVLKDRDGVIHRPEGHFYSHEGNQEETDLMVAKLQRWESHQGYTVMAEVVD
jgi:hypothetical protein